MPETETQPKSKRPGRRALWLAGPWRRGAERTIAWVSLATVLALGGTLAALLGARAVARSDADHARLAFHLASAEIAASLKQTIQHEEDLVVAAGAFVRGDPRATPAEFDRWTESVYAMQRYPELQNIGLAALVPASRLQAFESRRSLDPGGAPSPAAVPPARRIQLLPVGRRPYYCLAVVGVARSRASYFPPGIDYCALSPRLILARDLARPAYAPFPDGHATLLGVETPVYSGRVVPSTVAGRRSAFVGWLGELLTPSVVLSRALQGHQNLPVSLRYQSRFTHVAFARGNPPAGAQSATIDLLVGREALLEPHEGWTLQTFGAPAVGSVLGNWNAVAVLLGGSLLSLTLSLLMLLLSTGRGRALRELSQKNRELSHQALHDMLTGLPNRALVLDRAEQLLARAARQPGMLAGALFIDIDDFKAVNDSLGHAAGDLLLSTVARRLRGAVREQDTVGRFGGDEFVVLSELRPGEPTLELLADRLTEILREPVPDRRRFQDGLGDG